MKRNADPTERLALWQGRVAAVIAQCSEGEVQLLWRLIAHKEFSEEEKARVLRAAVLSVLVQRKADREEEAKLRRKRNREQARQDKEFGVRMVDIPAAVLSGDVRPEPHEVPAWAPHDEIERGPHAPDHEGMSPDK